MKSLLLILIIFILQNFSIVKAKFANPQIINPQYGALAKFWGVANNEVPKLLKNEKLLIMIDNEIKPLLNDLDFGGTYIDVKANKIGSSEKEETFNSSILAINSAVLGGDRLELVSNEGGNQTYDFGSAGFWVRDQNGRDYLLTAGHLVLGENITSMTFYHISAQLNNLISPVVMNNVIPFDYKLLIKDAVDIITPGVHVCKTGYKTGTTCGEVTSRNTVERSESDLVIGVLKLLLFVAAGDSGDSLCHYREDELPYVDAVGIIKGGDVIRSIAVGIPILIPLQNHGMFLVHY
ncbi:6126_t:CDS:2 [Racocetra persica]|uniref:6126_t:CDS:1 n=1 Tax=Racocetra persica TaxID=160502 RepID=A0ACA9MIX1_9GLOM|nr:6126_t:CDS:2 [Racocetra persica]